MENKKETDVGITIQTWDETQKCAAEFKKLLRILTARIKNLEETRFSEELRATIDQELNCFSERITDTAAQLNEIPHLVAELQNTMLKFNLTNQLPHIRRERGRALIPATDSGFDSTTYSGTSKIINSGIIPSTNRPFDDETYSDTTQDITNSDKNIKAPDVTDLGGIQDTNPPGNPHHSCQSLYIEACSGNYLTIKTEKDFQC